MSFTTENLERAVSIFYTSDHLQRAEAHQWLTTAQRCMEAWSFVWELLQPQKGTEIQFFAATTLHTKLLRCWDEVPFEHYEELKTKILEAIVIFSNGPKLVLNRLCISLAAYYLQRGGSCDLADLLRPFSEQRWVAVLLEILTVIPEEFNSVTMSPPMQNMTRQLLQKAAPGVLQDMRSFLASAYEDTPITPDDLSLWTAVGGCSASWLALVCSTETSNCTPIDLNECLPLCDALLRVVHKIYWVGGSDLACGAGEEAACAAIRGVRAAAGGGCGSATDDTLIGGSERHPRAALTLASTFSSVVVPITMAVNIPNGLHQELLVEIFSTAITLAKTHSRTFTKALVDSYSDHSRKTEDEGGVAVLELILSCLASPGYYPADETHSGLTFNFWFMLQDEISNLKAVKETTPFLLRLLHALLMKSRTSPNGMSSEDADTFQCYRMDISDTILQLSCVLPWETCANCAASLLIGNDDAETNHLRGPALMALEAIADGVPLGRVPEALSILLAVSSKCAADPNLIEPLLNCLGSYAPWLGGISREGPNVTVEWCKQALAVAAGSLGSRPGAASLALGRLCSSCAPQATHIAPLLIQAVQSGTYNSAIVRRLVGAAGCCAVAMGAEEGSQFLAPLYVTLCNEIQLQDTSHMNKSDILEMEQRIGDALKACGILLAAIHEIPSLGLPLVEATRPVIVNAATRPGLTEALFQFLRQCITSLPDDIVPLLPEFMEAIGASLYLEPHCISIDVSRLIVLMYINDDSVRDHAKKLFVTLVESCLQHCSVQQLSDKCDILEEFFAALTKIAKRNAKCLELISGHINTTINLASSCIQMAEKGTSRNACRWLSALVVARPADMMVRAPNLTAQLVHCIGGGVPRGNVEILSELLVAMSKATWDQTATNGTLSDWLQAALSQPGYPTPHATDKHKKAFIKSVTRNRSDPRRILEGVHEFSLVCRGLYGTEYARQSLQLSQRLTA